VSIEIVGNFINASRESRRSILSLIYEATALRFFRRRIGFSEYFDYNLYLNDLNFKEKTAFGGWRSQQILEEILVDDYSQFLSLDKITMYSLLNGFGFPIPDLKAVYRTRRPHSILNLASPDELEDFLGTAANLPVYIKRACGSYGKGNIFIKRLVPGALLLGDESLVSIKHFCQSLDNGKGLGWILQEPLMPHKQIASICGDRISGVRVHTFLCSDRVEILSAIFKINVGSDDSDNFCHGASGNMLAALDLEKGIVTRVISGVGLGQRLNNKHPRSGQELLGFQLPYWPEIKSLCQDAQLAFPGYICPGWDIAICDNGPKILEVNFFGDIDLFQHSHRIGFLNERLFHLMSDRGIGCIDKLLRNGADRKVSKTNGRIGIRKHHWNW